MYRNSQENGVSLDKNLAYKNSAVPALQLKKMTQVIKSQAELVQVAIEM